MRLCLPPLPARLRDLPVDERGYPVPYFVEWIDGKPDHRIASALKWREAIRFELCWICGQKLGAHKAFAIGPMCTVNRISAEPPQHRECSIFSAQACPFLSRPQARRREAGLPDAPLDAIRGRMIRRNPGVTAIWVTKRYRVESDGSGGAVVRLGEPVEVVWFREGRTATREEVLESFDDGCPALRELAEQDGAAALAEFEAAKTEAMRLLPEHSR